MDGKSQRALLAASVAGILAAVGLTSSSYAADSASMGGATANTGHCYGINKCKGTGDCGGKGHSCAGQNTCKGQGFIDLSKKDCLRIEGGRLTAEPGSS